MQRKKGRHRWSEKAKPSSFTVAAKPTPAATGGLPAGLPGSLEWAWKARRPLRHSAVVVARNEGEHLLCTVESLLMAGVNQVVVVDDASEDGCASPGALPGEADVFRKERPEGVAAARNSGLALCDGDVLSVWDAHCYPVDGERLKEAAEEAVARQAMVCASCTPMKGGWTAHGGSLLFNPAHFCMYVPLREARDAKQAERYAPVTGLFGSVYIFPKEVHRRLGGWIRNGVYGYNEQTFSMECWFAGVPVLADRDLAVPHRLKPKQDPWTNRADIFTNAFVAHKVLFSKEWFDDWWEPGMLKANGPELCSGWTGGKKFCPSVAEQHEAWMAKRVRTDEEFFMEVIGKPLGHQPFYANRSRDSKA